MCPFLSLWDYYHEQTFHVSLSIKRWHVKSAVDIPKLCVIIHVIIGKGSQLPKYERKCQSENSSFCICARGINKIILCRVMLIFRYPFRYQIWSLNSRTGLIPMATSQTNGFVQLWISLSVDFSDYNWDTEVTRTKSEPSHRDTGGRWEKEDDL